MADLIGIDPALNTVPTLSSDPNLTYTEVAESIIAHHRARANACDSSSSDLD